MGAGPASKKLASIARDLIRNNSGGEEELADDAETLGLRLPADFLADKSISVLAENWPIVETFCGAQTQWRYGPSGHPTGLDYPSVKLVAGALEHSWQEVFPGVQAMEMASLNEVAKRSK